MNHRPFPASSTRNSNLQSANRQGSILLLTCFCLIALLAAAALSVDVGYLQVQKSRMQNAVDAAALAASQEITLGIRNAPIGTADPTAYAISRARTVAAHVAELSGVYVNPQTDVFFGQRQYNNVTKVWTTDWNAKIANTVRVVARREHDDPNEKDGKLRLFFGGAIGTKFAAIKAEATAFVRARDIVVIHDFSRSMNFDSHFPLNAEANSRLSDQQIVENLRKVWDDLQPTNTGNLTFEPKYLKLSTTSNSTTTTCEFRYDKCAVTSTTGINSVKLVYTNGTSMTSNQNGTIKSVTVSGSRDISSVEVTVKRGSGSGTVVHTFNDSDSSIQSAFGLGRYPFSNGSWSEFFNHARNDEQMIAKGYREKYGGLSFANYILRSRSSNADTPRLAKSRHYPFTSIKEGHALLCDFLKTLSFDDHIGMVSYDSSHRIENYQNVPSDVTIPFVDIRNKPLTDDYDAVNNLMKFKQANHYSASTNIGGGLLDGMKLLDDYRRGEAQPTILLMTDGNSNVIDRGGSSTLPNGWNWNTMFDYDGDGVANYSTTDSNKRHVLLQAYNCVRKGYVINTMAVGSDADRELLAAIAWMGGGIFINVPGGVTTQDMETQLLEAFQKIASMVPPGRLLSPEDE